jgi:hypothetical protein
MIRSQQTLATTRHARKQTVTNVRRVSVLAAIAVLF